MYFIFFFFREKSKSESNDLSDKNSTISGTFHVPSIQVQEPNILLNNNNNDVNTSKYKIKKTFKNALPQVSHALNIYHH